MDKKPSQSFIAFKITKEDFKKQYTLRAKIGIRILQLLQVVRIEWL